MWFVITIFLSFSGGDESLFREYKAKTFNDT